MRSAREDFGPGEWLALQSGYWQPRDYVKEVGLNLIGLVGVSGACLDC